MIFIQQRDAVDCGPSCLAMIAKYYGRQINREQLRNIFSISKDGVSLLAISKAAETIGFKTIGGCLGFDALVRKSPLPCIVHWNQNHFVVVYKIFKNRKGLYTIYVADPGIGLVTYTKEEFCEHWVSTKKRNEDKGISLLIEPTERFYSNTSRVESPLYSIPLELYKEI